MRIIKKEREGKSLSTILLMEQLKEYIYKNHKTNINANFGKMAQSNQKLEDTKNGN